LIELMMHNSDDQWRQCASEVIRLRKEQKCTNKQPTDYSVTQFMDMPLFEFYRTGLGVFHGGVQGSGVTGGLSQNHQMDFFLKLDLNTTYCRIGNAFANVVEKVVASSSAPVCTDSVQVLMASFPIGSVKCQPLLDSMPQNDSVFQVSTTRASTIIWIHNWWKIESSLSILVDENCQFVSHSSLLSEQLAHNNMAIANVLCGARPDWLGSIEDKLRIFNCVGVQPSQNSNSPKPSTNHRSSFRLAGLEEKKYEPEPDDELVDESDNESDDESDEESDELMSAIQAVRQMWPDAYETAHPSVVTIQTDALLAALYPLVTCVPHSRNCKKGDMVIYIPTWATTETGTWQHPFAVGMLMGKSEHPAQSWLRRYRSVTDSFNRAYYMGWHDPTDNKTFYNKSKAGCLRSRFHCTVIQNSSIITWSTAGYQVLKQNGYLTSSALEHVRSILGVAGMTKASIRG
jgi:hypothetical protein